MPDRLCPSIKSESRACGAPLLPGKKLCPACRLKARRAVNRRAQAAFRARKKAARDGAGLTQADFDRFIETGLKPIHWEREAAFRERQKHLPVGGCGKPGHVTVSGDEGTCYCATCEQEAKENADANASN